MAGQNSNPNVVLASSLAGPDDSVNPDEGIGAIQEARAEAQPDQPEQAGNKPLPRWIMPTVAGVAAVAAALTIFANSEMGQRVKERWIPGYAASGEQDVLHASTVGLQFNFGDEAPSDELLAVFSEGDDSIIAGLRSNLDDAYTNADGGPVNFDYFYGQPVQNEDGSEDWEYVPFGGGNGGDEPTETFGINLSGLKSNMTPEERAEVLDGILGECRKYLKRRGHRPIVIPTTTGEYPGSSTTEDNTDPTEDTTGAGPDPTETQPSTAPTQPTDPETTSETRTSNTNSSTTEAITNKQEMYPQELLLNNNQIVNIGERISGTAFSQYANGGFNLAIPANGQTYIFRRADDLNKRAYYENQFRNGNKETAGLYLVTGQKDGKVASRRLNTYEYTINNTPAGYEVYIVPDRNDTSQFPGNPAPSVKSINISVGGNTGMPFTYWVYDAMYIIPDKQTIMLN